MDRSTLNSKPYRNRRENSALFLPRYHASSEIMKKRNHWIVIVVFLLNEQDRQQQQKNSYRLNSRVDSLVLGYSQSTGRTTLKSKPCKNRQDSTSLSFLTYDNSPIIHKKNRGRAICVYVLKRQNIKRSPHLCVKYQVRLNSRLWFQSVYEKNNTEFQTVENVTGILPSILSISLTV